MITYKDAQVNLIIADGPARSIGEGGALALANDYIEIVGLVLETTGESR